MPNLRPQFLFLGAPSLLEIDKILADYFVWIATGLGLVASIGYILGCRPRAKLIPHRSYIDCKLNQIFEEFEFKISWGYVFFIKKLKLGKIERDATFTVLCKPLGGIKDTLHTDYYDEKTSRSSRTVYLVNKDFYKKNEIQNIFIEINRPAPPGFLDKIEVRQTSGRIEVLNWNHIEVRGFPMQLPKTITLNQMPAYFSIFNSWTTPGKSRKKITAFLKSLPPCEGNEPGKVIV